MGANELEKTLEMESGRNAIRRRKSQYENGNEDIRETKRRREEIPQEIRVWGARETMELMKLRQKGRSNQNPSVESNTI